MKIIDSQELARITGAAHSANLVSVHAGLAKHGSGAGLAQPHRLVAFLAQISHESQGFYYDREVWGPTSAQLGYEGRDDLGNIYAGDGSKFRGYTSMQITGRHNTTEFYSWCQDRFGSVPNFVLEPHLMNTDPWEGLGPIWYWDSRGLNRYADSNDFRELTRRINGGYNGMSDRQARWNNIALRLLGFGSAAEFQAATKLKVDGDIGPNTKAMLFRQLTLLPMVQFAKPDPVSGFFAALVRFFSQLFGTKG